MCVNCLVFSVGGVHFDFFSIKNEYFKKILTMYLDTWKVLLGKNKNNSLNFKCFLNTNLQGRKSLFLNLALWFENNLIVLWL